MKTKIFGNMLILEIENCNELMEMLAKSNIVKVEGMCNFKIYVLMEV